MYNHSIFQVFDFSTCDLKLKGFKVGEIERLDEIYNRNFFYKIYLITGKSIVHYADKEIKIEGANLLFYNSYASCNWKFIFAKQNGYACLFTKDFLEISVCSNILQQLYLFEVDSFTVFSLNNKQENFIAAIFQKMIVEQNTNYIFKDELLHNYISLIIHGVLKMQTSHQLN
jgi:AraC family transcriptional activator of pobA